MIVGWVRSILHVLQTNKGDVFGTEYDTEETVVVTEGILLSSELG